MKNALLIAQLVSVQIDSQTIYAENVQSDKKIVNHVISDLKTEFKFVKNAEIRDTLKQNSLLWWYLSQAVFQKLNVTMTHIMLHEEF